MTLPALLALGVLSAPAASAGNPCFHGYQMPSSTTGSGTDIKLMPCAFEPTVAVIDVGQSVTFINGPDYAHLVTGAGHEWGSAEVEVQPNETVTYAFDAEGVYPYACALHPGMSGAIVVGDPTNAAPAGAAISASTDARDLPQGAALLIALGVAAGVFGGAAVAWKALRRRATAEGTLARAE